MTALQRMWQVLLHHPFMTSTRRVGGGQARVDAWGRGEGVQPHVDVHTEN